MNAHALIIGNNDYALERDRLKNAVNDADDFATRLQTLGFTVSKLTNVTGEQFDRAVTKFGTDLKKYQVGLFYFSGHGLQIDGVNYLAPTDTSFADDISAKHTAYQLDRVIDYMNRANPAIRILILDACRDNPLPSQYRGNQPIGLAPIFAPKGTLIAFSTSPGEKAMDYGAGRNSIYTGSLLNHINDVNIPIEEFFKRVRTSVYTLSGGKQTSWEHTSLIGTFYFNSKDLLHSVELPYRRNVIADGEWMSEGKPVDQIIEDLKSYTWDTQKSAIGKIRHLNLKTLDDSDRFLLGRNILQTALGNEFSARHIMENLPTWLASFQQGKENHVLNGMLYETFFDSEGRLREDYFKAGFLDQLYQLQSDQRYITSIEFIRQQLQQFPERALYLPGQPPPVLAIDAVIERFEVPGFGDQLDTYFRLRSVKHENQELLHPTARDNSEQVRLNEFKEKLGEQLGVPLAYLRLSTNIPEVELKRLDIPWRMRLSRDPPLGTEKDADF